MTKAEVLTENAQGRGCLGRSADDEPLFVLCARDLTSDTAVRYWINLAAHAGASDAKLNDARRVADAMRDWRERQADGGKVPD